MQKSSMIMTVAGLVSLVAMATVVTPVYAAPVGYKAVLKANSEVPPSLSTAAGTGEFTFDSATKVMTWTITYSGLTGQITSARLEPSMISSSFPAEVPFGAEASPVSGRATLTDAQIEDLVAGRLYVNIHTNMYPGGEIRGQITQ